MRQLCRLPQPSRPGNQMAAGAVTSCGSMPLTAVMARLTMTNLSRWLKDHRTESVFVPPVSRRSSATSDGLLVIVSTPPVFPIMVVG